jgi:AcrR family transcriptional regulator
MGRRSDHTREELRALLVELGARQMAQVGLAQFSARETAKAAGYTIGTIYNVFGSYDGLILAINADTLGRWTAYLKARLERTPADRLETLVRAYLEFAEREPKAWIALFEHRMADDGPAPDWYQAAVAQIVAIAAGEVAAALPAATPDAARALTRSLIATVHGHCLFSLFKTFDLLGETAPAEAALARVREAIAAALP